MIVFMSAAYARDNFFSTENIIKLRMRLIHECGLYSGFYGICYILTAKHTDSDKAMNKFSTHLPYIHMWRA